MKHYVFKSKSVSELYGVTEDKAGAALDPTRGPWLPFREVDIVPDGRGSVAIQDPNAALADIAAEGAHYTSAGIRFDIDVSQ